MQNNYAVRLDYLNLILKDRDTYNTAKQNFQATDLFDGLTGDVSYEDAQKERDHLAKEISLSYSVDEKEGFASEHLSSNASQAFSNCVKGAMSAPGLHIETKSVSGLSVSFTLHWIAQEGTHAATTLSYGVKGGEYISETPADKWHGNASPSYVVIRDEGAELQLQFNMYTKEGAPITGDSLTIPPSVVWKKRVRTESRTSLPSKGTCGWPNGGANIPGNTVSVIANNGNERIRLDGKGWSGLQLFGYRHPPEREVWEQQTETVLSGHVMCAPPAAEDSSGLQAFIVVPVEVTDIVQVSNDVPPDLIQTVATLRANKISELRKGLKKGNKQSAISH